jgi:predicted  nucleic acid-binding Zn-ribbon protein
MRGILHVLVGAILALGIGGSASGQQADVFAALLTEVRQIRAVLDRAAGLNPRIQIALYRLDTQRQQVSRLSIQLDGERVRLQQLTLEIGDGERELTRIEEALNRESDPKKRKDLEQERTERKYRIERLSADAQHTRQREAELSSQFDAEQLRWNELNAQLDALMRTLEQR